MTRDLSTEHQPLGALFENTASPPPAVLTSSQIESFHREGYVAGIEVLSGAQVDVLTAALADLMRPDHPGRELFHEFHLNESSNPGTVLFHALGAWRVSPAFHDLLWLPAIVGAAAQLLGGRVRFWHDQLFCKPPRQGGVVAWHQDYSYWTRTQPMAHLTCWIALDDATEDNGCLRYVPRSHRWPLLPITGLAGRMGAIESVLTDEQRQAFVPVPIELPRGSATFHHPLMVHGSSENRSERPRRGAVLNFIRDGVRSASDEPLLQGIPPVPAGALLAGRFFPLLTPDHAPGRGL